MKNLYLLKLIIALLIIIGMNCCLGGAMQANAKPQLNSLMNNPIITNTGNGERVWMEGDAEELGALDECPAEPSITPSTRAACSGGTARITGTFGEPGTGDFSGTFNITELTESITNIEDGQDFTLPINTTCTPVTYSFLATAICDDPAETPILGDNMTTTITVYPDFNADLMTTIAGNCISAGMVNTTCDAYLINGNTTLPDAGETGTDILTVDYNYQGNTPADGACFEQETITVDYACEAACPSEPKITANVTSLCSGGTAKIDGTFGELGSEGGTIIIEELGGEITDIVNGEPFTLPVNTACEAKTYTFTAKAFCEDGSEIPDTVDDLVLQIRVYPAFNLDFVRIENGVCAEAGTATTICDAYELTPITITIPDAGEAGTDIWEVSYNNPDAPNCFAGASFELPFNCGAACPSAPVIEVDESNVCSGGSATIIGYFGESGSALDGRFSITETSGIISNIQNGVPFDLPENTACIPITYTFLATAICEDNSNINPNNPEDMSVTVTVYPVFNPAFIEIEPGNCDLVGQASSTCPNYDLQITAAPTLPNPGEVGEDIWEVNYFDAPVTCFVNEPIAVPYNCGVACPSGPFLETNRTEICSGGRITLTADFQNPEGTGEFVIFETSETITNIQNGVPIELPENTTCNPVTYTFGAAASCNGVPIVSLDPEALLVTVTVYPDFNEDLVKANPGTCGISGTLDVICTNYRPIPPDNLIIPEAGESGSQIWAVDYIGGLNCFTTIPIDISYACDIDCPKSPKIVADIDNVCSEGQVRITGTFGLPSNIQPDFEITETSGAITGVINGTSFTVPENTSCDPIDYIFTAVAFCNGEPIDANNQDMTVTITVYPTFNDNFISVKNGVCGVSGQVESTCDNYEINALTTTIPEQGESGADTWLINYTGSTCIVNEIVQVPYGCGVTCPTEPSISSDKELVCGGEAISMIGIFGNTDGGQGGYFEITELSGTITDIQNGIAFTIPPNNQCDPITYTFSAKAFCDDNTPVEVDDPADLTFQIKVYPEYNDNFINFEPGTCDQVGVATSICDKYILTPQAETLPEPGENGFDEWTVSYNSADNFDCFNNPVFNVPYSCGQSCPSAPIIEVVGGNTEFCGGSSITINGLFRNLSDLGGYFEIVEISNAIENIEAGIAFELPENNGCNPQNYTFTARAFCIDGTEIQANTNDMTINITVYPLFNVELLDIQVGNCGLAGSVALLCNNYEAILVSPSIPTVPDIEESGEDLWYINYIAPNGGGFGCFINEEIKVPYACGELCPTNPSIKADQNNICSGDKAKITGFTAIGEDATFDIRTTQGDLASIENGQVFDLPINNSCDPITYTFTATAKCIDGSNIAPDDPSDMIATIIVYPEFNEDLIQTIAGTCGQAGAAQSICDHYNLIAPENPTIPEEGDSGFDTWIITYNNSEKVCFRDIPFDVAYSCNVDCPANPSISTSQLAVCSEEVITINGAFQVAGGEGSSGTFTIIESSNEIKNILEGVPFKLPENNSCTPKVYTFRATAQCADGTEIIGEAETMNLSITVYPTYNDNFITINPGTCGLVGSASANCPNYELTPPDDLTIPEEGDIGNNIWFLNYPNNDGVNCIDNLPILVPYSCGQSCPTAPKLNVDQVEICSGEQLRFFSSFADNEEAVLPTTFVITELSGQVEELRIEGEEDIMLNLPINKDCEPKRYTFRATVTCNGANLSPDNEEDLLVTITVYPIFNPNLIAIQNGDCEEGGRAISNCANYEVQSIGVPTIPREGESGFDKWQVVYIGESANNEICMQPEVIDVPYGCNNACPQDPRLTAELLGDADSFGNTLDICGGEAVIFRTSFGIEGETYDGSFTISSTDIEGEIPIGSPFPLPTNNTCEPINYTFIGVAICDDGLPILVSAARTVVTITVYPNAFNVDFIDLTEGNCVAAGIATTTCANYQLIPPIEPTIPVEGEKGKDRWRLSYIGVMPPSGLCISDVNISVPYDCSDSCPSEPYIQADASSGCSAGMMTINAGFRNNMTDDPETTFDIYLQSDPAQKVPANEAFELPENNTCEPITLTYEARAFCANGNELFGAEGDLVTTITLYPKPSVPELITIPTTCHLEVTSDCPNLVIEYLNQEALTWENSIINIAPKNTDSITWRAYHKDAGAICQTSGITRPMNCPKVEEGCPYPVVVAKESTLNAAFPLTTSSDNGPIILFCRLPASLQPTNFDPSKVRYEWGFYNQDFSIFTVPGKGAYTTNNWQFMADPNLGIPSNVNESFFLVNPNEAAISLDRYGVLVTNDICAKNVVINWQGKTTETQNLLPYDYLQIFPNPTVGQFSIELYNPHTNGTIDLQLYNQMGQLIYHFEVAKIAPSHHLSLIMEDLDAGVYLVKATLNGNIRYVEKLVKY